MNRRLLWLLVPAIGLGELAAHAYFANRAPTIDEWKAVAPAVAELRKQDELVVVAPAWAEPAARHALGEDFFPLAQLARPDAASFTRAIELSAHGKRSDELAAWRVTEERAQGDFVLRVLENPKPEPIRFSFVEQLETAEVSVAGRPCRFHPNARVSAGGLGGLPTAPERRFECGGNLWVGVTVIDDHEFRPRRCIWTPGAVNIRFSNVTLGDRLRVYTGIPWLLTRDGYGASISVEVRVDGSVLGSFTHPETSGWEPFEVALGERAGRQATVEFETRSEAVQNRLFCFYADSR